MNNDGPEQETERSFPPFHAQEEYKDKASAQRDKQVVEFNRALLIHGISTIGALEWKL